MKANQDFLPVGWIKSSILDLCQIGRGRVISQQEITLHIGEFPVYSSQTQNNGVMGSIDTYDFDGEFVTWTTDGANAGTVFFRSGKFNCTNVCGTLKEKNNNLDLKFLAYKLSTVAKNHVSYVGNPKLMNGTMSKVVLSIPVLKKEQTKIAAILYKVDESIIRTQNLIDKYTRIKTGLIQDLLTKGLDENGAIRSEEKHEFKDSPLGRIPKEWECEFLGKYIDIMGGYAFKSGDFVEDGVQLLRMGNLYNNNLSLNRDPIFLPSDFVLKHPSFVLKKGDIIMSMTGTSGKRDYGFAVEVNIDKPLLLNQRVCKFSFLEDKIDKTYLINLLHYETYLSSLYENASGTKQANLNSENILNIYVPFPSKAEQIIIGKKINALDATLNVLDSELSKLKSLKRGLMQDLLSGIVRVN